MHSFESPRPAARPLWPAVVDSGGSGCGADLLFEIWTSWTSAVPVAGCSGFLVFLRSLPMFRCPLCFSPGNL